MAQTPQKTSARLLTVRASLERHKEYLALLQAVSEAANESRDLESVLGEVLDMVCESLEWPLGHAFFIDDSDETVRLLSTRIWHGAHHERFAELRACSEELDTPGALSEAIASGEPQYINLSETEAATTVLRIEQVRRAELSSMFVCPIRSDQRIVAVLEFFATGEISDDKRAGLGMLLRSLSTTVGRVAEREQHERYQQALLRVDYERERAEERAAELASITALLRRRNAELDQFAYVASHDLRAPLRGIANLSSWIAKDLEPHLTDDTHRYLGLLKGRVQRMEALINGLLEYSRVGRTKIAAEEVEVRVLIDEIIDLLAAKTKASWQIGELPHIRCQRLMLRQVFHNLMSNALKHARSAAPQVTIEAHATTLAGNPGWRFSVQDNGEGIDPRYHERIWQIFQTLRPRDEVEGTGIGLSLVRKIVENQGGEVGVESSVAQGARFYFTWPSHPPASTDTEHDE